jgi:hypothetical protein
MKEVTQQMGHKTYHTHGEYLNKMQWNIISCRVLRRKHLHPDLAFEGKDIRG